MARNKKTVDRRKFLGVLAAGAGAAATGSAALPGSAAADTSDQEKRKARYQETPHVKTFYRVNRYPK